MAKILVQCSDCGKFVEVTKFWFLSFNNKCACGKTLDTKQRRRSITCATCGNSIVVNAQDAQAKCPICDSPLDLKSDLMKNVEIACPDCNCLFWVDKEAATGECPACGKVIDVKNYIDRNLSVHADSPNIIRFGGDENDMLWKHPMHTFNYLSQLIVREGEEALFLRNGKISEPFAAGNYLLEREKIPFQDRFALEGKDPTFASEVVFINMSAFMSIKWGTPNRITMPDPVHQIPLTLGAHGTCAVRVIDPKQFYLKHGVNRERLTVVDMFGDINVEGLFRDTISSVVRSSISRAISEKKISILYIDSFLDTLSFAAMDAMNQELIDFGMEVSSFHIGAVSPQETKELIRLRQMQSEGMFIDHDAEMQRKGKEAESELKILMAERERKLAEIEAQKEADRLRIIAEAEAVAAKLKSYEHDNARQDRLDQMEHERIMAKIRADEAVARASVQANAPNVVGMPIYGAVQQPVSGYQQPMGYQQPPIIGYQPTPVVGAQPPGGEMVMCVGCGRALNADAKFCPFCGKERATSRACPQCGAGVSADNNFCPKCGRKLN